MMNFRKKMKKVVKTPKEIVGFLSDFIKYKKYSSSCNYNKENVEYITLYYIHAIEKGMSIKKNMRPFGREKVKKIVELVKYMEQRGDRDSFVYNYAIATLFAYKHHHEINNFVNNEGYIYAVDFLSDKKYKKNFGSGVVNYAPKDSSKNYSDFLMNRRSVRGYAKGKIDEDIIQYAIKCASLSPSACNRQMIRAYFCSNGTEKIKYIMKFAKGIGGFETDNINFIIITFDLSSTMNEYERNQGYLNAGLFGMNLINALHEKKIGSCFVQFANKSNEETKLKKELSIPSNEQIAVLVACGKYKKEYLVPASIRRDLNDILKVVDDV